MTAHTETAPDSAPEPRPADDHPAGVRRVLAIMAMLGAIAVVPYFVPGLAELQPWQPGSAIPFVGLFEFKAPVRSAIAGVARKRAVDRTDEELLEAAPLPDAPEPEPARPMRGAESPDVAPLRVDPSEYRGMTRAIVGPEEAMEHFHRKLMAVARGEADAKARILVYSDSINGADRITSAMRRRLHQRFGDGGKGWVPIAPGWRYQRHQDVEWSQERRWRTYVVNRGNAPLDRYGLGGVLAMNISPNAEATFATADDDEVAGHRVGRYVLYYQAWPEGGEVELSVDGGRKHVVDTRSDEVDDRTYEIDVPDGAHSLLLHVEDREAFRGYGVVMERDGAGVVVDGLQLIGAFTRVLRNFDVEHWQNQIHMRSTDLMMFWLGGNDTVSESVPFIHDKYVRNYSEVIRRAMGSEADASCLIVSVLDSADTVKGQVRTRRRVPAVVAAQKEVAGKTGCGFLNAYEAIGGRGTMRRWYRSSPRLVTSDYRHLTEAGARVVGSLFYKAILKDYDDFLARR